MTSKKKSLHLFPQYLFRFFEIPIFLSAELTVILRCLPFFKIVRTHGDGTHSLQRPVALVDALPHTSHVPLSAIHMYVR